MLFFGVFICLTLVVVDNRIVFKFALFLFCFFCFFIFFGLAIAFLMALFWVCL